MFNASTIKFRSVCHLEGNFLQILEHYPFGNLVDQKIIGSKCLYYCKIFLIYQIGDGKKISNTPQSEIRWMPVWGYFQMLEHHSLGPQFIQEHLISETLDSGTPCIARNLCKNNLLMEQVCNRIIIDNITKKLYKDV